MNEHVHALGQLEELGRHTDQSKTDNEALAQQCHLNTDTQYILWLMTHQVVTPGWSVGSFNVIC